MKTHDDFILSLKGAVSNISVKIMKLLITFQQLSVKPMFFFKNSFTFKKCL